MTFIVTPGGLVPVSGRQQSTPRATTTPAVDPPPARTVNAASGNGGLHVQRTGARLDYAIDWAPLLGGDELASSGWTVTGSGLRLEGAQHGSKAVVWVSGGTSGQSYRLTNRITTAAGRTDERSLRVEVRDR